MQPKIEPKKIEFALPFQSLFRPARYKVFYGGRGGAKSWEFARALLLKGVERKLRILCAREYQTSIADSVHKLLGEQLVDLGLSRWYDVQKTRIVGMNGTEFIFKGLRHNIQEIKSTEGVDIAWIEEAQSVSNESWDVLIPTIRQADSEIWISFNPIDADDPTYKRFVLNPPPNAIVQKVSFRDNPWFPDVLLGELEYLRRVDPEAYQHVWEGETRVVSDAVILRGKYRVAAFQTPEDARFYFGADWGFSQDPTALIRCYIIDRTLYIDHEAYGIGVDIDDLARRQGEPGRSMFDEIEGSRRWTIWADCARPETISYVRQRGFDCRAAPKWKGSIEDGIAYLRSFEEIVIHERCRHAAEEFRMYRYKTDPTTGDVLPVIDGKNDHCFPGDTLVSTDRGRIRIDSVRIGDMVTTRNGYRRVLWSGATGRDRPLLRLETHGGLVVEATPEHPVYSVERGFVRMDSLREGEPVLILDDKERVKCPESTSPVSESRKPYTKASFFGDIPTPSAEPTGCISSRARNGLKALITFIGRFGKTITATFRRITTSTTKTGIVATTPSKTLNAFSSRTICGSIVPGSPKNRSKPEGTTSEGRQSSQRLGTGVTRGTSGMSSTGNDAGMTSCPKSSSVSIAGRNTKAEYPTATRNSVQTHASPRTEEAPGLTTNNGHVQPAGNRSWSTNTPIPNVALDFVRAVSDAGKIAPLVFDLTVERDHEFFANGILVHNCVDALRYALHRQIRKRPENWVGHA